MSFTDDSWALVSTERMVCPVDGAQVFSCGWWDDLPENGGQWIGEQVACSSRDCAWEALLPVVNEDHEPVLYRPEGESRHTIPAEVCNTCSDFDAGRLVPASFCEKARAKMEAEQ